MRALLTVFVTLAIGVTLAASANAQVCGDVTGQGYIDVADLSWLLSYLGTGEPVPPSLAMADMDDHTGITISDAGRLADYLFGPWQYQPDCTPSQSYSFAQSSTDTVFLPYMNGIPDGIDSVSLPVTTSMGPGAYSLYLPLLTSGPGGNGLFHLSSISSYPEPVLTHGFIQQDTVILMAAYRRDISSPVGRHTSFKLNYRRNAAGVANIAPVPVNRSTLLIPSFERNSDLFKPILINTEVIVPPETLKTTPLTLAFSTMAGMVAADSFLVNCTSNSLAISFNLTASDPWIILKNLPPTPMTTPASIWVKADATSLPAGSYHGQITITPVVAGKPAVPSFVPVSFTVATPVVYPPGDLNCDGIANLADLSAFVSYLTGGGAVIKDCNR